MIKEGGPKFFKQELAPQESGTTAPETKEGEPRLEQVLIMLKPGALDYEERLEQFLFKHNLKVVNKREMVLDKKTLLDFYPNAEVNIEKRFPEPKDKDAEMGRFINYFSGEPAIVLLVEGKDVYEIITKLKLKLRGIFKLTPPRDGLHSSDDTVETESQKRVVGFEN